MYLQLNVSVSRLCIASSDTIIISIYHIYYYYHFQLIFVSHGMGEMLGQYNTRTSYYRIRSFQRQHPKAYDLFMIQPNLCFSYIRLMISVSMFFCLSVYFSSTLTLSTPPCRNTNHTWIQEKSRNLLQLIIYSLRNPKGTHKRPFSVFHTQSATSLPPYQSCDVP